MGITSEQSTIGEHGYEITTFGAKKGQAVLLRLFKVLGPAAAEIASKGAEGIGSALALAAGGIADADLDFVLEALAQNTKVTLIAHGTAGAQGVPVDLSKIYDGHFAGRWDEWALWIGWGVQVNFASFFGGKALAKLLAKVQPPPAKGSGSESPTG